MPKLHSYAERERAKRQLLVLCFGAIGSLTVLAQATRYVLARDGRTIVLEPYAPFRRWE